MIRRGLVLLPLVAMSGIQQGAEDPHQLSRRTTSDQVADVDKVLFVVDRRTSIIRP